MLPRPNIFLFHLLIFLVFLSIILFIIFAFLFRLLVFLPIILISQASVVCWEMVRMKIGGMLAGSLEIR